MAKQGLNKGGSQSQGGVGNNKLLDDQEKDIREMFASFDKDNNKFISRAELVTGLRLFYFDPTNKEVNEIYRDLGLQPDEKITYDIFHSAMAAFIQRSKRKSPEEKKADLRESFKVFDKNKSGYIDEQELKQVLTAMGDKMTDAEVSQMFNKADINKDGKIQIDEFVNALFK